MREPLYRISFDAAMLLREHPPRFDHPYKKALFEIAYPAGTASPNQIEVTQWAESSSDVISLDSPLTIDVRPGYYDYQPVGKQTVEWHVNFADPRLFVAYGSRLFAQDESQVAEHPLLGCVREALLAGDHNAETADGVRSTPIVIRNVERVLEISTNPDTKAGRPNGLYGNRFNTASFDAIRQATRRIDPASISNIIAMAAPAYGRGEYSKREIEYIFNTAVTGFSAARQESFLSRGTHADVVVHSGFWGCGAFGGNRKLMIALQVLAARTANISQLILHAGDPSGIIDVRRALDVVEIFEFRCGSSCSFDAIVSLAMGMGFRWGVGDGN